VESAGVQAELHKVAFRYRSRPADPVIPFPSVYSFNEELGIGDCWFVYSFQIASYSCVARDCAIVQEIVPGFARKPKYQKKESQNHVPEGRRCSIKSR
jgi:hypothetical protein